MKRPFLVGILLILTIVAQFSQVLTTSPAQADIGASFMAIGPSGLAANSSNWLLLADYGSYSLYRIPAQEWTQLPPSQKALMQLQPAHDQIVVAGGVLYVPQEIQRVAKWKEISVPGLYLVHFVGPIQQTWLDTVTAVGGVPVHYVASNSYLVWAEEGSQLLGLPATSSFVDAVLPYDANAKVPLAWQQELAGSGDETAAADVTIQMLRHPGQEKTEQFIEDVALSILGDWESVLRYQNIRAIVPVTAVPAIAARSDVVWVGPTPQVDMMDEVQAQILAGQWAASGQNYVTPGYMNWLDTHGFSVNPYDYPIVEITDDGVGLGGTGAGDMTLSAVIGQNEPFSSRLVYVADCTASQSGGSIGGHGHLNLSIAGGMDGRQGEPYQDEAGFQRGLGVNPYGRFASTRIFGPAYDLSNCGYRESTLIQKSYQRGARISSNSWGCTSCNQWYDTLAQTYDTGTRDADPDQPGNQELFFVFAAGNAGPYPGTITSPGTAKNVMTVGASENLRPGWTDGCFVAPSQADNIQDIAVFSGRGPAPGGRIKPEVVAPGTHIQGTASPNPGYDGSLVCDMYYPQGQTTFAASSGTSHAAPAIAGAASLATYWLKEEYGIVAPSPALLKGYLLAHTRFLTGEGAQETLPGFAQGYGLPDLSLAFDGTPHYLVDQSVVFDDSGDSWSVRMQVAEPNKPVRVVLVYTDQPGVLGGMPLVNDLDLSVSVKTAVYRGNWLVNGVSADGGQPDRANNYELVTLPAGSVDKFVVTVSAFNVAGDGVPNMGDITDQDFALVCYNCITAPDFSVSVINLEQEYCISTLDQLDLQMSVSSVLSYTGLVQLSVAGDVVELSQNLSAPFVVAPGNARLQIGNLQSGQYRLLVAGDDGEVVHVVPFWLHLRSWVAGVPVIDTAVSWSGLFGQTVTLKWQPVEQASQYVVEIAEDEGFARVVETAVTGADSHATSALAAGKQYYWRVRGENICGAGTFSPAQRFEMPAVYQSFLPLVVD
ncbi:MAG: hypothetical protein Kow0080_22550 [Candidatus Promineifilaceae bacterium]